MSRFIERIFKRLYGDADSCTVSDRILTVPNIITFMRLALIPLFWGALVAGSNISACLLFALASSTDCLDGQIARRTNSISKLGRLLDPAVDRLLMITGVLGLYAVGRLPLWIILFVVVRDVGLLAGGAWALARWRVRVDVIFPGKIATALIYTGFVGLLLDWPRLAGLGIAEIAWLPGVGSQPASWGIWFVYVGLCLAGATTLYYLNRCFAGVLAAKRAECEG